MFSVQVFAELSSTGKYTILVGQKPLQLFVTNTHTHAESNEQNLRSYVLEKGIWVSNKINGFILTKLYLYINASWSIFFWPPST